MLTRHTRGGLNENQGWRMQMIHRNFEVTVRMAIVYVLVVVLGCSGVVQGKKQKGVSSKGSVPSYLKDYEKKRNKRRQPYKIKD